jgi:hypothetical protein
VTTGEYARSALQSSVAQCSTREPGKSSMEILGGADLKQTLISSSLPDKS